MRKPKSKKHALKIKKAQEKVYKKVYRYDLNMQFIDSFKSVSFASEVTGIDRRQISANCNNRQRTCGGFIFKFNKI